MRVNRSGKGVKRIGDKTIVKSSAVHGPRQMRCPRCHGMAGPSQDPQGKEIFVCGTCGTRFGAKPF
jgi:transcription elongation factor Elf1